MFPIRDHNPSERTPFVTYALIVANVAIFLSYVGLFADERALAAFYIDWAMVPASVTEEGSYFSLITSMFLHGGWMHLIGNMLFLYIFGDNIEDLLGHLGFLLFYLACGIGAALAHVLSAPLSAVPTVGASGAIAGVMGGYLLMFPRAKVDILFIFIIFFRIFTIPAWIMLGVWFALQLFNGVAVDSGIGGVAYWAHAGGFVIGVALMLPVFLRRGGPRFWQVTEGHPPHPEIDYARSSVPRAGRRRGGRR